MRLLQSVFNAQPDNYRWAAQDANGAIYLYEQKPDLDKSSWADSTGGESVRVDLDLPPWGDDGWKKTLTERKPTGTPRPKLEGPVSTSGKKLGAEILSSVGGEMSVRLHQDIFALYGAAWKWAAVDKNGKVHIFVKEPYFHSGGEWDSNEPKHGKVLHQGVAFGSTVLNWQSTKIQRKQDDVQPPAQKLDESPILEIDTSKPLPFGPNDPVEPLGYDQVRMLLDLERSRHALAEARVNAAEMIKNGRLTIAQFTEIFG